MLKMVRVVLVPAFPDKSGDERIFLDLVLNPDKTANAKLPTFGLRGDGWPKPTPQPTIRPFVIYADGKMDFGDDADDPWDNDDERFSYCDIFSRNRIVAVGEFICVVDEGQEDEYRIAQVTELGMMT